jgi:hypothetical protein
VCIGNSQVVFFYSSIYFLTHLTSPECPAESKHFLRFSVCGVCVCVCVCVCVLDRGRDKIKMTKIQGLLSRSLQYHWETVGSDLLSEKQEVREVRVKEALQLHCRHGCVRQGEMRESEKIKCRLHSEMSPFYSSILHLKGVP